MNEEILLLIKLLLAHLIGDFVFQTKNMAQSKSFGSGLLYLHVLIIFGLTWAFSFSWKLALVIASTHLLIDLAKSRLDAKRKLNKLYLFVGDQVFHALSIVIAWYFMNAPVASSQMIERFNGITNNYFYLLLFLGYLIVTTPTSYFIEKYLASREEKKNKVENAKQSAFNEGGKMIGILERILVLTLVLLNQYEAIGFLIAGKSILRFANSNEEIKSEVVLIGTLLSFVIAMAIGVMIKYAVGLSLV